MGDPVDVIKDVALGVATGGLYNIAKATEKTISTGSPLPLLTQGLDLGVAAVGNDLATEVGGPAGGIAFNLAGAGLGYAGSSGAFSGLPGFTPGGSTAAPSLATSSTPIIPTPEPGTIPVAAGTTEASTVAAQGSQGGLANLVGLPGGTVATETGAIALPKVASGALEPYVQGYTNAMNEIKARLPLIEKFDTAKGWFESLSPGAQTALVTGGFVGGQMVLGSLQGMFAGVSAQKKLDLEKLINQQAQNQIQYRNRNNQYAPLLTFQQPGLAQTV